jgi:hypothetical protein
VLSSAPAASAAPTPVGGLRWFITIPASLDQHLAADCFLPLARGWDYDGNRRAWGHLAGGHDAATGGWDVAGGRGSVRGTGAATLFDSFTQVQSHTGHAWELGAMGLELRGGRVAITATIRSARSVTAALKRQTIAVIAHPRFHSGVGHRFDRHDKDLGIQPNSYVMSVEGKATIAAGFVAATHRWRCKGHPANFTADHVHVGDPFGSVLVSFGVRAASGLAGTLALSVRLNRGDDDAPVAITAAAPATGATKRDVATVTFAVPDGSRTPLACDLGASCVPSGGGFGLAGGLVLALDGRSATVDGLAIAWSPGTDGPVATITGAVDGQPMTIAAGDASGVRLTGAFLAAAATALGAELGGALQVDPQFTATGPAG